MTQDTARISFEDPTTLAIHPLCRDLPMLDKESPEWAALVNDIRDRGIDVPIIVDAQNRVVDGRHRLAAAKALKLKSVPLVSSGDERAEDVIIAGIFHRRHLSKSAQIYLAYPLIQSSLKESKDSRSTHIKPTAAGCVPSNKTADALAARYGVGRNLVFEAAKVHKLFEESDRKRDAYLQSVGPDQAAEAPANLRAEWEERIMSGDIALGACVAGIAGAAKTKGKKRMAIDRPRLFASAWKSVQAQGHHWDKLTEEERDEARQVLIGAVAALPPDIRRILAKAIATAEKDQETE
jgi:hypothetical protein